MFPSFDYVQPASLESAIAHLADPAAVLHAGGTDLLGCLRERIFEVRKVVSISALQPLQGIAENADGALAFMADEVTFLRLRQTVTRDELSTTFLGYFETTDVGGAGVDDVVDTASIFVEPADSPVDGVDGRVYRLNAEALVDLSATIPFLGKYQRYYFREEAGDWKIFAIL